MENFFTEYGLWALAGLLFVDDLGIPLPGSTLVFTAATLSNQNPDISIFQVLAIALLIPPCSNAIMFFWGRHGARNWIKEHGHKFFLPEKHIKKAEGFFKKYGEKTVFIGGVIPGLRPFASLTAGSLNMKPAKFFFYHLMGLALWASVVVGSGYFFGEQVFEIIKTYWQILLVFIMVIILGKIFWDYYKK